MLDFSDLEIKEEPVITPDGKEFTLREANGKAATDHRNAVMACTIFGPDGKVVGVKDLSSVEARLVAACLWDDKGRNPAVSLIQSWPARVQKALFEKVKELSDMGEDSPLRDLFIKALSREDSPITLNDFSDWIKSLGPEYSRLERLFTSSRESAKNSQAATTNGSQ